MQEERRAAARLSHSFWTGGCPSFAHFRDGRLPVFRTLCGTTL